jgi:hypothetical protein
MPVTNGHEEPSTRTSTTTTMPCFCHARRRLPVPVAGRGPCAPTRDPRGGRGATRERKRKRPEIPLAHTRELLSTKRGERKKRLFPLSLKKFLVPLRTFVFSENNNSQTMEAASSFALIFFYINECADEFLGPLMPATTQFLREKKRLDFSDVNGHNKGMPRSFNLRTNYYRETYTEKDVLFS